MKVIFCCFRFSGHYDFVAEQDFRALVRDEIEKGHLWAVKHDYDPLTQASTALPDSEWMMLDEIGNVILQGRDEIECETGELYYNHTDRYFVKSVEDLDEADIECLWSAYLQDEHMSDDLKDAICTLQGVKRVHNIRRFQSNLECECQSDVEDGCPVVVTVDTDQMEGLLTRDEWADRLRDMCFCPLSVEMILDELDYCCTNTSDFFADF